MTLREGRWDCPSCGAAGIRGRQVDCPSCGKPRPSGVRFYLPGDAPELTDPELRAEARAGADWVCEHCGASNRARRRECGGCGAPRGNSPTQRVIDYGPGETPGSGEGSEAPSPASGGARLGRSLGLGCLGLGCLAPVLVTLVGIVAAVLVPAEGGWDLTPAVVESRSWERAVELERRRVVTREGWELPDSAVLVRRRRGVREHEQVVEGYRPVTRRVARAERVRDGTETHSREVRERVQTGTRTYVCGQRDLGNGYFEDIECTEPVYETRTRTETYEEPRYRDETRYETVTEEEPVYRSVPVYGTHYTYRIPEWSHSRTLEARGDTTEPAWPEVELRRREREARRTESYGVVFREAGGKRHPAQVSLELWRKYRVGKRVALRVTPGDSTRVQVLPADSLRECRRWHAGRGEPPPDSLGCAPRAGKP